MAQVASAVRYLAIVNFAAFVIVATLLGGDALNGHADGGHYFLSWHGRDTEVSSAVFRYSQLHAVSTFVFLALAALAFFLSKPSPVEAKWQGRLVALLIAVMATLAFFKNGA